VHNQEDDTLHELRKGLCRKAIAGHRFSLCHRPFGVSLHCGRPRAMIRQNTLTLKAIWARCFQNVIFGLLLITYDLCHSLLLVPPPSGKEGGVLVAAGWVKPTDTEGYPSGRNPTGEMPVTKESTRISVEPRPLNKRGGTETVHLGLNGQPDFPPGKRLALSRRSCHPKY